MTRIDRWLWAARFYKTRGLATEAVAGGRVRLNDERVKPAKEVHPGDRVEVRVAQTARTVVVSALAEKRGSASVAATLYEETPESRAAREQNALERRLASPLGADLGARADETGPPSPRGPAPPARPLISARSPSRTPKAAPTGSSPAGGGLEPRGEPGEVRS